MSKKVCYSHEVWQTQERPPEWKNCHKTEERNTPRKTDMDLRTLWKTGEKSQHIAATQIDTQRAHKEMWSVKRVLKPEVTLRNTKEYTAIKNLMFAHCVANHLHSQAVYDYTRWYTQVKSYFRAHFAQRVLHREVLWTCTKEYTQGKGRSNVENVEKHSKACSVWRCTKELTFNINNSSVISAILKPIKNQVYLHMRKGSITQIQTHQHFSRAKNAI